MKLFEILTESVVRQFKRTDASMTTKYRCGSGPRKGKLTANPTGCGVRRDPKKVQQGKRTMRSKKGIISRKSLITKRKSVSKQVSRLNKRLSGK